ncbi:beta-glucosidase [Duganella sp. CF402]|nr:beta-glucosidase [Duganella sp. CF402]
MKGNMNTDMCTADMAKLTAGASMWTTPAILEAGIPALTMADGPMGIASPRIDERDVSLLTPAPIALGASWDRVLVRRVGQLVGGEAVRCGVDLVLAPNLNLARSPLAGRAFEYFSEDPVLCGTVGAAWIEGCQSVGTGAVAKHLVCNDSETERDKMNAVIDEQTLRDVYLLPFEMAANAGCAGMLTGYNKVNGEWCAEAGTIINTIAKQEWGFPGVFMSDWFGTHSTVGSLAAGLDLEMPGPARYLGQRSAAAVAQGLVPLARLQDAAQRVAHAARRFSTGKGDPLSDSDAAELLVDAAAAGFTLVRNEDAILPLDLARFPRIAVIGPNASAPCFQGGTFAKIAVRPNALPPLDALRARLGAAIVAYESGVDPQPKLPRMMTTPARSLGDGCVKGMTIDYFVNPDLEGDPVFSETRDTNSLTWLHGVHGAGAFQHPASTRASGVFIAAENGVHIFYVGGTGALRLRVDGVERYRSDQQLAAGDVMGRLKSGDADLVSLVLEAGKPVLVEVELRYTPARGQGLWFGIRGPGTAEAMMARAVACARGVDAVILIVGETSDSSVESKDRTHTRLPADQIALIERVCAANANTVIATNVGHAFDAPWEHLAKAVLHCWYPGEGFGAALAQVLAGDREPGGRMPVTIAQDDSDYPALSLQPEQNGNLHYSEGARIGYRGLAAAGRAARHAFGSGRGYATFEMSQPSVKPRDNCTWLVSLTLRNTSARAGAEVVQVYRDQPELALLAFEKFWLAGSEERRVSVIVEGRSLRQGRDARGAAQAPLALRIGRSSAELPLTVEVTEGPR